jgi:GNAT acetyltransferase
MTERELLRLHLEAVWGISVPPLDNATSELSATTPLPPWSLYQANLSQGQVTIWRPAVSPDERADLLHRARNANVVFDGSLGMRREVLLRFSATPPSGMRPQLVARHLTADNVPLLEAFEAGSAAYFLSPACAPCFGVIIDGTLVCVAHSSRRTASACELGINTASNARRHGYATTATRAWTHAMLDEGLTPIYSAFADNTASLRLAAATGYVRVSESVYGIVRDAHE